MWGMRGWPFHQAKDQPPTPRQSPHQPPTGSTRLSVQELVQELCHGVGSGHLCPAATPTHSHVPTSCAQTLGQAQAGWGGDGGPALAGDVHAIYQKDTGVREEFRVDGARR